MDYYHVWFDLKHTAKDLQFARSAERYLGLLLKEGLIEGHRLSRRKLGFGPAELGDFHVEIRTRDMAQLERAFERAAAREGEFEALHRAVYSAVTNLRFALYRDFPDSVRARAPD